MALQQLIVLTDLSLGLADRKQEGDGPVDAPHSPNSVSTHSVNNTDLNNDRLGGVGVKSKIAYASTCSLKSEGEAGHLKGPTVDESNVPGVNYANSWLAHSNARPPTRGEVTNSLNCPQVPQNDMQKIAARGKQMEDTTDTDIQQCTNNDGQQYLKERGLLIHKASVILNVLSAEQESMYQSSQEAPVSFHTTHAAEHNLISSQNVLKGCLSPKDSELFDSNKAGNVHNRHSNGTQLVHIYGESGKRNTPADLLNHVGAMPTSSSYLPMLKEQVLSNPDFTVPLGLMQEAGGTLPLGSPGTTCAQLTLFYAGTVNVYDNVPADKAQAIMFLAGCGGLLSDKLLPAMNTVASSFNTLPAPRQSLPSMLHQLETQHTLQKLQLNMHGNQSATEAVLASAVPAENKKQELSNVLSPCQTVVPRALPVARKASLVRFLEKRKERVRSAAPYSSKESNQDLVDNKGKTLSNANHAVAFYNGLWGCHAEDTLGSKYKLLDDKCKGTTACEMDVEDQNWLSIGENPKQVLEAETATQFSSSSA